MKRCSETMQQIYKRTPMSKQSNFIEIALRHGCSLVYLLHVFRIPFLKNNSEGLLLWSTSFFHRFSTKLLIYQQVGGLTLC